MMSDQNTVSSGDMTPEIEAKIWESACLLYAWHRISLMASNYQAECRKNMLEHAENIGRLGGVVGQRTGSLNTIYPVVSYALGVQPLSYEIGASRSELILAGLSGAYTRL